MLPQKYFLYSDSQPLLMDNVYGICTLQHTRLDFPYMGLCHPSLRDWDFPSTASFSKFSSRLEQSTLTLFHFPQLKQDLCYPDLFSLFVWLLFPNFFTLLSNLSLLDAVTMSSLTSIKTDLQLPRSFIPFCLITIS